jgi:predicted phage tail protein
MWLPTKAFDLFRISRDTVDAQREELAALRAERDGLKAQLSVTNANFEWLRVRINSLEAERAQLIKKAYGIDVPVPEIVRTPRIAGTDMLGLNSALFEDVGETAAKELGLPTYN